MLDCLIPMGDGDSHLNPVVRADRDSRMIDTLASNEVGTASANILHSTDSNVSQSPVHEPRGSTDEVSSITAQDIETLHK